MTKNEWWSEKYGFFGKHYLEGDNSQDGYLTAQKQTLEERTIAETEGIIHLLGLKEKQKILDIPSGYGRHCFKLAKRGLIVTGSELNSVHLNEAKRKAKKENVPIKFTKENMIDIKYNQEFDSVINIFYSFGFFKTDNQNKKVLSNFYKALKTGGKFLMHTDVNLNNIRNGKYKLNEKRLLQNGKTLKLVEKYSPKTKRINGSWVIGNQKKNYSVRVYEVKEFINLCRKVGFKDVKVYSDWNGSDYNDTSEMLIFVAEK